MNAFSSKSLSDNRKAAPQTAIQNRKWAGIVGIVFTITMCGAVAEAQQQPKVPRIGYVTGSGGANNPGPNIEAFQQGLRDLGYIERKNILVEYRYAEGNLDQLPGLVAELVQLKPDVLVVEPLTGIHAAKQATKTISIVIVTTQDPVATGIVDSLARPGGNITGLTTMSRELKWQTTGIAERGDSGDITRRSPIR